MKAPLVVCVLLATLICVMGAAEPSYLRYESGNPYDGRDTDLDAQNNAVVTPMQAEAPAHAADSAAPPMAPPESSTTSAPMSPPEANLVSPVMLPSPSDIRFAEKPRRVRKNPYKVRPLVSKRPPAAIIGSVLPPEPILRKVGEDRALQEADTGEKENPEILRLNAALEAVKEEILSTNKQINDERKWVAAVSKITSSYADKMKRVSAHIVQLRAEMKKLYQKKKMIENLKLQKQLEAKLKEANNELGTLQNSLKHVQQKNSELNKSHQDLKLTIAGIEAQISKLKGDDKKPKRIVKKPSPPAPPKKVAKGLKAKAAKKAAKAKLVKVAAKKAGKLAKVLKALKAAKAGKKAAKVAKAGKPGLKISTRVVSGRAGQILLRAARAAARAASKSGKKTGLSATALKNKARFAELIAEDGMSTAEEDAALSAVDSFEEGGMDEAEEELSEQDAADTAEADAVDAAAADADSDLEEADADE